MENQRQPNHRMPNPLHQRLDQAERGLLRVHKALLQHERVRYEQERGRISGPAEFLQILIHDPWFAWLRPISQLAAEMDEFVRSKKPTDPQDGQALLAQARQLLMPQETGDDFHRQYHRAIQESPEVATAHADWRQSACAVESES